jgi:hypothetical protein
MKRGEPAGYPHERHPHTPRPGCDDQCRRMRVEHLPDRRLHKDDRRDDHPSNHGVLHTPPPSVLTSAVSGSHIPAPPPQPRSPACGRVDTDRTSLRPNPLPGTPGATRALHRPGHSGEQVKSGGATSVVQLRQTEPAPASPPHRPSSARRFGRRHCRNPRSTRTTQSSPDRMHPP